MITLWEIPYTCHMVQEGQQLVLLQPVQPKNDKFLVVSTTSVRV
jgi:hypothetical protein